MRIFCIDGGVAEVDDALETALAQDRFVWPLTKEGNPVMYDTAPEGVTHLCAGALPELARVAPGLKVVGEDRWGTFERVDRRI